MINNIHHPKYIALIDWLVEARKNQSITIRTLGEQLDEPHQTISKIELRVKRLSILEYYQYCNALKLDPMEGIRIMESVEE